MVDFEDSRIQMPDFVFIDFHQMKTKRYLQWFLKIFNKMDTFPVLINYVDGY